MVPYHEVLETTEHKCIEATVTRRTLLHAGHVERVHDERLPYKVMRAVMVEGKTKAGRPAGRLQHYVTEYCSNFEMKATT